MIDGVPAMLVTDFNQTLTGPSADDHRNPHRRSTTARRHRCPQADAPPLSPELVDTTPPIVVPLPPAAAFSSTTMLPVTLPLVFTLAHRSRCGGY